MESASVEQLLYYCEIADIKNIQTLLSEDCLNVNSQDCNGITALQVCSSKGFVDIVALLLSIGGSVDLANFYGWTPLLLAALYGHLEVIQILLKNKAKVNHPNKLGLRPLAAAAWGGHLSVVRSLMQNGAIIELTDCSLTPLLAASYKGHASLVRLFLESGANVNAKNQETGITALILASASDFQPITQTLVEWGVDINHTTVNQHSALDIATILANHKVKVYLDDKTSSKNSPEHAKIKELMQSIREGNHLTVKKLLGQKPVLCNCMENGVTPLMLCSSLGDVPLANILISYGSDINQQDYLKGWNALMYSVYNGNRSMVQFLIEAGAEVEATNKEGLTAFDLSCLLDKDKHDIIALVARRTNSLTRSLSPKLKSMFQDPKKSFRSKNSIKSNLKAWFHLKMPRHSSTSPESSLFSPNIFSPVGPRLSITALEAPSSPSVETFLPPVFPGPDKDLIKMPGIRISPNQKNPIKGFSFQPKALLRNSKKYRNSSSIFLSSENLSISSALVEMTLNKNNLRKLNNQVDEMATTLTPYSHDAVVTLLEEMCLQKYIEKFRSEEIDFEAFQNLTEEDLDELGVLSNEPRKSLLALIRQLNT